MASVLVHGISIPANKGITRLWDGAEKRWFPKQWAQYQEYKDDRDRELRAAEEGERDSQREVEQRQERGVAESPREDGDETTVGAERR
jgi:hypothetical protein